MLGFDGLATLAIRLQLFVQPETFRTARPGLSPKFCQKSWKWRTNDQWTSSKTSSKTDFQHVLDLSLKSWAVPDIAGGVSPISALWSFSSHPQLVGHQFSGTAFCEFNLLLPTSSNSTWKSSQDLQPYIRVGGCYIPSRSMASMALGPNGSQWVPGRPRSAFRSPHPKGPSNLCPSRCRKLRWDRRGSSPPRKRCWRWRKGLPPKSPKKEILVTLV